MDAFSFCQRTRISNCTYMVGNREKKFRQNMFPNATHTMFTHPTVWVYQYIVLSMIEKGSFPMSFLGLLGTIIIARALANDGRYFHYISQRKGLRWNHGYQAKLEFIIRCRNWLSSLWWLDVIQLTLWSRKLLDWKRLQGTTFLFYCSVFGKKRKRYI